MSIRDKKPNNFHYSLKPHLYSKPYLYMENARYEKKSSPNQISLG